MNDISIASISDGIGLSALLTEQTLALAAEYGLNFLAALLTIFIGIWASRRASAVLRDWLTRSSRIDRTLAPILAALVRYAILTLTLVVTLGNFGVETTSIIAVLGAAELAIGLALQGTLSNVAAGLMLLFLRPFKVGDWVETAGVSDRSARSACSRRLSTRSTMSMSASRIRPSGHRTSSITRATERGGWILT